MPSENLVPALDRWGLSGTRAAIDRIDDAMVLMLAGRQRLASLAGRIKRHARLPQRDAGRERQVCLRAHRLARRSGLAQASVDRLMALLISEAHQRQRQRSDCSTAFPSHSPPMPGPAMSIPSSTPHAGAPRMLLRCLPPPRRWRALLSRLPAPLRQRALLRLLAPALAVPEVARVLAPIRGRRLGIEVADLDLRAVFELREDGLCLAGGEAEAAVAGTAADLLLLASRLEDADTLFFQRRLALTGDTELGLLVRNLLDRLPWESLPLASRIVLQRGARFAREARSAYRAGHGVAA